MTDRPRPRVSVIMIFLDAEPFITQAVDSILHQTFDDFEVILVDDGSGPACSGIARQYAELHPEMIRYVDHPGHANRGMSASRNRGLAAARGELVAFLDADDVWHPIKLEEQVAILDRLPEVAMVCGAARYWCSWAGGVDTVVPTGHLANTVIHPPGASLALYPLGAAAAPCPSDLLVRREAIDRVGGFEEHFTGTRQLYEDQGFLAKLYLSAPVYFSDRVWLDYRQHDRSCVAEVTAAGHYRKVRGYFLDWLDHHVAALPACDPRVARAIRRARRRNRHPSRSRIRVAMPAILRATVTVAARLVARLG